MPPHKHQELLTGAIEHEGEAHRQLLDGDRDAARAEFATAADLYRQSWEAAHERAFGRLVGMLKASVLAGDDGLSRAAYTRAALAGVDRDSATANYARAIAALIAGDDEDAGLWAARLQGEPDAFGRTGEALAALAAHDAARYAAAVEEIVRDFERRSQHLTGVAIADTALMLEVLAARSGIAAGVESPVLPAL